MDPLGIVRPRSSEVIFVANKFCVGQGAGSNITTSSEWVFNICGCGLQHSSLLSFTFSFILWSNGSLALMDTGFGGRRQRLGVSRRQMVLTPGNGETKELSRYGCSCEFDNHPQSVTVPNFYFSSYPAVYIVTVGGVTHQLGYHLIFRQVLPITAARFTQFQTNKVPWGVTAWADTLLLLSGFFNTILYTLTRPKLLPRRRRSPSRVVLTSTGSNHQFGRTNRFQNHKHYPFDTKSAEEALPSMSFELGEPLRSSSDLRFAHPLISNAEQ